jgi:poly-beta-1,6-N-acetyl-D-glucosamine synthase
VSAVADRGTGSIAAASWKVDRRMGETMNRDAYVLVTAAYNEEKYIEQTLRSIVAQTLHPAKWIVVSDGSTDKTDEIVKSYAAEHDFIQLCRISEDHPRNFAAQVYAINRGLSQLEGTEYSFVGNLDADITLEPDYFSRLLEKFRLNPNLGLGGGSIYERSPDGGFFPRTVSTVTSVAHACQLFRRECFDAIGGAYRALRYGGPDTYAETSVRMKHWQVSSFSDLKVFHHRPTNSAEGVLRGWFRQGKMDYSLGALPAFEFFKLLRRVRVPPYVLGSLARCAGFLHSYAHREERLVPQDFIAFLRQEQKERVLHLLRPARMRRAAERNCVPPAGGTT